MTVGFGTGDERFQNQVVLMVVQLSIYQKPLTVDFKRLNLWYVTYLNKVVVKNVKTG